ncbi:MAG: hypothetical protein K8I82_23430 [Anaerolineae bacterium]|nr:hypothetical protein [Anaerolineae bacterium]
MSIGDSIVLVSCLAGTMFALPALLIFLNMAFSRTTERAAERLERGVIVPFFVGLLPVIFIGVPATLLISIGSVAQFCGTIVYLLLLLWAFAGLGVVSHSIGRQMGMFNSPFMESLIGAVILAFAIAFPLIGWVIILPFSLIIGVGAMLMAVAGRFMGRPLYMLPNKPPFESDPVYQGA